MKEYYRDILMENYIQRSNYSSHAALGRVTQLMEKYLVCYPFPDKVANRFSKFVMLKVYPSLKPISIIFSIRASDSL